MESSTVLWICFLLILAFRGYRKGSLNLSGAIAGLFVGLLHVFHHWRVVIICLVTFYISGTFVTRYKSAIKEEKVQSETASGGPRRSWRQVLATSGTSTLLIVLHWWRLAKNAESRIFYIGFLAAYACSTADTFSSEIGILSKAQPVSIITWKKVPPGTNGGITLLGLLAGGAGGLVIGVVAILMTPLDSRHITDLWLCFISGLVGTLSDSLLGALFQATYFEDKVIEGAGGQRPSKVKMNQNIGGKDILDNNQVNFVSTLLTASFAMAVFR